MFAGLAPPSSELKECSAHLLLQIGGANIEKQVAYPRGIERHERREAVEVLIGRSPLSAIGGRRRCARLVAAEPNSGSVASCST